MAQVTKICWLVDTEGWAFENRAKAIRCLSPDYDFDIVKFDASMDFNKYDVIVCEFLPWMNYISAEYKGKIILGLRSFRALDIHKEMASA
jgi:hypothetical protein